MEGRTGLYSIYQIVSKVDVVEEIIMVLFLYY